MSILLRLTRDLSQILEWQLSKDRADPQRVYAAVLLLLGERRSTARRDSEDDPAEVDIFNDAAEEFDAESEHEAEPSATSQQTATLAELRAKVRAYRCANPYINGLLFRDYRLDAEARWKTYNLGALGNFRIHAEALLYTGQVLMCRPLSPARATPDDPTNLHKLLRRLCQLSAAPGDWAETDIRRDPNGQSQTAATWFHRVAKTMQARWRAPVSAIAANRLALSGPFWLTAGACSEKVGDEPTLQDVIEIAPRPIRKAFNKDPEFLQWLGRVIDSVNYRYRLLRDCGLPPDEWLHQKEPSINQLEQLAELRERAAATDEWKDGRHEAAYRRMFGELLAKFGKGGVGGFKLFEREPDPDARAERQFRQAEQARPAEEDSEYWLHSRVGRAMLARAGNPVVSMSGWSDHGGGDESGFDYDAPDEHGEVGGAAGDAERAELLRDIVRDAGPRLTENPVLNGFFQMVLVNEWDFEDLLALPAFQAAVERAPRYAGLDERGELPARLRLDAGALIVEVLLEAGNVPVEPVLREYLLWVVVEEKPFRGKGGLINRPSFKQLVAQNPELAGLSPTELEAVLHRQAMDLLEYLLARRG